jgi:DNA-binding MarR family transcriptional regulator
MAAMTDEDRVVRWLTPEEQTAWLTAATFAIKLPVALDAQLRRDAGISYFEYMVMAVLSEQDDHTLQMSNIAAATAASLSRLSHTATRLERLGYLTRARPPGPGRRTNATLTSAGYAKVVETAPGHVKVVRELVIDALSPGQRDALQAGLGNVVARLEDHLSRRLGLVLD